MRNMIFSIYIFTAVMAFAQTRQDIKVDKVSVGNSNTVQKALEFNLGQGASNAKITSSASGDVTLATSDARIGSGSATDQALAFDKGAGASNPKIKWNNTTSKIQFSNDGTTYKDIGSGVGGVGINLLENADFESGISQSWSNSGGTYSAITGSSNAIYGLISAEFDASSSGQYVESSAITVPKALQGSDCMAAIMWLGGDGNLQLDVMDGTSTSLLAGNLYTFSAQTTRKTAKVYFTCPSSGSVKLRVASTANAAAITLDQAHLGQTDSQPVSSLNSVTSYTTGCSGSWTTNTTYLCKKRRVGDHFEYNVKVLLSGAPNSTTLSINIPDVIDTAKLNSTTQYGSSFESSGNAYDSGSGIAVKALYNTTTSVIVGYISNGSTSAESLLAYNAPVTFGSGDEVNIRFSLPIVGLGAGEDSINSKCANDINCENNFSAFISSSGVVTDSQNFINGNCTQSPTGTYTCSFNSGVFSAAPVCNLSLYADVTAGTYITGITSLSSSALVYKTHLHGSGPASIDVYLNCQKSGADYKARQNIQGFLQSTVTSGANNERVERARFSCNSSSSITSQSGNWISSIGNRSTGCTITVQSGIFSAIPTCTFTPTGSQGVPGIDLNSTTDIVPFVFNTGGSPVDFAASIVCVGPR